MGSSARIVVVALVAAAGVSLVMELCRPLFYLVDDNLVGVLPTLTEVNRRLWSGTSPFTIDGIFGGNYDLRRDPGIFTVLSPWNLALSWLSLTTRSHWLVDAIAIGNSLTIAAAFAWSACWLREAFDLDVPDWLIICLGISYTFSSYNLIIGANWTGFLNAQAALPVALVGLLHPRRLRGVALVSGGTLYALFGGHGHVFTVYVLFLGLIALALASVTRRMTPLLHLVLAGVLVGALALPILQPVLDEMRGTPRFQGLDPQFSARVNIGVGSQLLGYVVGPLAGAGISLLGIDPTRDRFFLIHICSSIGNLLVVRSVVAALRRRPWPPLAVPLGFAMGVAVLFAARPPWLAGIMAGLPLLNAIREPYRDVWVLVALGHLLALWCSPRLPESVRRDWLTLGTAVTVPMLFHFSTFAVFPIDRHLIATGEAERYWRALRVGSGVGRPRLIVGGDSLLVDRELDKLPHALLGTFNFPSLFDVTSESGYSIMPPIRLPPGQRLVRPVNYTGVFSREDARRLAAATPDSWLILLDRVDPVEWTVTIGSTVRRFRFLAADNRVEAIVPGALPDQPR
jgi:hypothetical protein